MRRRIVNARWEDVAVHNSAVRNGALPLSPDDLPNLKRSPRTRDQPTGGRE